MSRTGMPLVYLAGPITGLNYGGATDWRAYAAGVLARHGVAGLDPMRGMAHLCDIGVLLDQYHEHPLSTGKAITARDRWDTQRADLVLMNLLGAERVSIGTMIEAGWADAARVPVVLVIEPGNLHEHAMLREIAGFVASNLDDALAMVAAILGRAVQS